MSQGQSSPGNLGHLYGALLRSKGSHLLSSRHATQSVLVPGVLAWGGDIHVRASFSKEPLLKTRAQL